MSQARVTPRSLLLVWPALAGLVLWFALRLIAAAAVPSGGMLAAVATSAVAAVTALLVLELVVLGLPPSECGLSRRAALRWLGAGLVLGVSLISVVVLVMVVAGWYRGVAATDMPSAPAMLEVVVLWACVAAAEECVFRGMVLRHVAAAAGPCAGLVVSIVAFSLVHAPAAGGDMVAMTTLGISGGLLFGAAWLAARSLWFPIGLHFGWNLAEANLFGLPVSNSTAMGPTLVAGIVDAPRWANSPDVGVEGGALVALVCVGTAAMLLRNRPQPVDNIPVRPEVDDVE